MVQPTFQARLTGKIPRVADITSFQFERPEGYHFQAGQWFVITFPGPEEPYSHHFSHSNSPLDGVLEFTTRLRGTEFKNALDALPLGAEVELEGPYGGFTLPEDAGRVVFTAGGIGITCVRSILRSLAGNESPAPGAPTSDANPSIVLLYANRSEASIPFHDELAELEARVSGLKVVHVISRPEANWQGYRGHVDRRVFERERLDPGNWTYYVSGPPAFGRSMREELVAWGVPPALVKTEEFEGY